MEEGPKSLYSLDSIPARNGLNPIVWVDNVCFTYPGNSHPTLRHVNLTVMPGEFTLVSGPVACGKTSLCDLLNGIIPQINSGVMQGQVLIDTRNTREIALPELAPLIGRVFQNPEYQFAALYVQDEVAFELECLGYPPNLMKRRIADSLGAVGLGGLEDNPIATLSGGEKQRLAIACALAPRPKILVLDEPLSNIDPGSIPQLTSAFRTLKDSGTTFIVISKVLDGLIELADSLHIFDKSGSIMVSGTPSNVLSSDAEVLLEDIGIWVPQVTEIWVKMRRRGLDSKTAFITIEDAMTVLRKHEFESIAFHPELEEASPILEALNLNYSYRGGKVALKNVSFSISKGELVAIVGRNGAGKTTLARITVGLLKPTSGTMRVFGSDVRRKSVGELSRHIGYVFQFPEYQFVCRTVRDEIEHGLITYGFPSWERRDRVMKLMKDLDLANVSGSHPLSLSAGQKRILSVAAMVVTNPSILMLDEPSYGLDRGTMATLTGYLKDLRQNGVTIILITHDMRLVEEIAERGVVMSAGSIIYDGPVEGMFQNREVLERASLGMTSLHQIIDGLRSEGKNVPSYLRNSDDFVSALHELQQKKGL